MKIFRILALSLLTLAAGGVSAQMQNELRIVFSQYLQAENSHNLGAVGLLLQDSRDFLWISPKGTPVTGRDAALEQLTKLYQGVWKIEPDMSALQITPLGDNAARLHVPIKFTHGAADKPAPPAPYLLNQIYVKTPIGWRIAANMPVPQQAK